MNSQGKGLEFDAVTPFSASALHYTIQSLDDGDFKHYRHSQEVPEANLTNFCIHKMQMGWLAKIVGGGQLLKVNIV